MKGTGDIKMDLTGRFTNVNNLVVA